MDHEPGKIIWDAYRRNMLRLGVQDDTWEELDEDSREAWNRTASDLGIE